MDQVLDSGSLAADAAASRKATDGMSGVGKATILLVEDEPLVRRVAEEGLEEAGYVVLAAAGARGAFVACEHHKGPIDLLVTDIVMPRMDGVQLAERLRRMYPRIRVLFISGYPDDMVVKHTMAAYKMEFLAKPFTLAALKTKIRELLERP